MSDKSEDPTPKRLQKAQEDGDSGASAQASQALAFLVTVSLAPAAIAALATQSQSLIRSAIAHAGDASPVVSDPTTLAGPTILLIVPILLAAAVTGAVAQVVQTGGFVATGKLTPKLERLDVFEGFKNLVKKERLFSVLRATLAGSIVGYLCYRGLRAHALDLARLPGHEGYIGVVASEIARHIARDSALFGLAIGAVDLVVTRRAWWDRLRMSKDEIKREYKESEGDPQMKSARERAHHEMLASATVANVKNATVVIVNPTHIACALKYDEKDGDDAPVVVASGDGDLARRIVQAAHAYKVPVLRDVPLARALIELQVGETIPEALYEAVAEILQEAWKEAPPTKDDPT